jgi:hypothetical protein
VNLNDLYPSRYLKASDLDGPVNVIIESINTEEVGKDKEIKPVVRFRGVAKPWIMNRTNANAIGKIHGMNTNTWVGKAVQLYATVTEAGGEQYDVIRVRPAASATTGTIAAAKAASQAPLGEGGFQKLSDEIPF